MSVWIVLVDCITDGEGGSFIYSVSKAEDDGVEAFERYKKGDAIPLCLEKGWFVYEDAPDEYDCGSTDDYLYNHIRVTLHNISLEG